MPPSPIQIRELLARHKLTQRNAAEMCCVELRQVQRLALNAKADLILVGVRLCGAQYWE